MTTHEPGWDAKTIARIAKHEGWYSDCTIGWAALQTSASVPTPGRLRAAGSPSPFRLCRASAPGSIAAAARAMIFLLAAIAGGVFCWGQNLTVST